MKNPFKILWDDIKGLWLKEKPTIEKALEDVEKAIEPVWKTALGALVTTTVQGLQTYAAENGGAAAAKSALATIKTGIEAAGHQASDSLVNTLIELAVQKLKAAGASVAASEAPPVPPAPPAPAAA